MVGNQLQRRHLFLSTCLRQQLRWKGSRVTENIGLVTGKKGDLPHQLSVTLVTGFSGKESETEMPIKDREELGCINVVKRVSCAFFSPNPHFIEKEWSFGYNYCIIIRSKNIDDTTRWKLPWTENFHVFLKSLCTVHVVKKRKVGG